MRWPGGSPSYLRSTSASLTWQTWGFPDQDCLAHFFRNRFVAVGYHLNALKTMRDCHAELWRDDDVAIVHYIHASASDRSSGSADIARTVEQAARGPSQLFEHR